MVVFIESVTRTVAMTLIYPPIISLALLKNCEVKKVWIILQCPCHVQLVAFPVGVAYDYN